MREIPLFIEDPKDGRRKLVGIQQVHDDHLVWFKRISTVHVLNMGALGFDAMTFETHFANKMGNFKVVHGDTIYTVGFKTFAQYATMKDYGHGKQWVLAFTHWRAERIVPSTPIKLTFGVNVPCSRCHGEQRLAPCALCKGIGYVAG